MDYAKRFLLPAATAAALLVVFARVALRRRSGTNVELGGFTAQGDAPDSGTNETASGFAVHGDWDMMRWIPVIVPSMALVLATGIYLICAAVL